jgi:Tol biopolymer transport system component
MSTFRRSCLKVAGPLTLALAAAVLPQASASAQSAREQQPSPNGKVLFQSTQGSDTFVNEIYTMESDGKRQVRLTYNEFDDTFPLWSPQGDRIAFLTDRGEGYDIYLMNPDGTGERRLRDAANGGPLLTDNMEWSPDGKRLLYAVGGKIYAAEVIAPDGSYSNAPVQDLSASAPVYAFDNNATWSPDGSRVAFISNGCSGCLPDLFVINADGTGRTQLTTTPQAEFTPRWSAAGLIAYGSFRSGPSNIYVMNADGTGDHALTVAVADASSPAWSPDGTRIVFQSEGPATAPRRGLYTANADGSGLMFLTDQCNSGRVIWSPDGTKLVGHASNDANWIDVMTVDAGAANRHATNLTKTRKADEFAYSWQQLPTP